jgi:heavy metal translocating P-type ATPase
MRLSTPKHGIIAVLAIAGIVAHVGLRFGSLSGQDFFGQPLSEWPLLAILLFGGVPLVVELLIKLGRRQFGSDLLAGMAIITSAFLGQYLAGALVVLMLSGGEALEAYAVRSASSVLEALAQRMPSVAHCEVENQVLDVPLDSVAIGNTIVLFPHEICPVDGKVLSGHGVMDESYLTGEPYRMSKAPGSEVISGSLNGETVLRIRAGKRAVDSRYAKIMQVMRSSEQHRPRLRRLGDQLGALYTPLAVAMALVAWGRSGNAARFLAVLVVATPCPLLIAIPVAIIGSISLAARRSIVVRDPAILEKLDLCRVAIFDKTGTLTYGRPELSQIFPGPGFAEKEVLALVASLERYSKHPLAGAILRAAEEKGSSLVEAIEIHEPPGEGLRGMVKGRSIQVTGRKKLLEQHPEILAVLPPEAGGLECIVMIDGRYSGTLQFHDEPRPESASFISHLRPRHQFDRVLLVSGDREAEVRRLAEQVGIDEVYFSQSPEQKLALVRRETAKSNTVFLGDGINDAPALTAATVGIAFGQRSDITCEAAGAVIMESTLQKADELLHIGRRMRRIALQSAVGGMALSLVGMSFAAFGYLPPVAGAIVQEIIDVFAVLNALRACVPPKTLCDYG